METFNTSIRWDLSNLLCGLDMEKFKNYLGNIKEKLIEIEEYSKINTLNDGELTIISQAINKIESAESFYYCLTTESFAPSLLTSLNGTISTLKSQVHLIISNLQEKLSNMSENQITDWSNTINQKIWEDLTLNLSLDEFPPGTQSNYIYGKPLTMLEKIFQANGGKENTEKFLESNLWGNSNESNSFGYTGTI